MSGKRYTDEFKAEAVKQATERGHSVADVAQRLGITTHSLYAWKTKLEKPEVVQQAELNQRISTSFACARCAGCWAFIAAAITSGSGSRPVLASANMAGVIRRPP